MSPRVLYRTLAQAEAVTWGFLILGMVVKYVLDAGDRVVQVAGPVHGFVFMAFSLATLLLAVDARWSPRRTALGLLSAVVPFASVPFEGRTDRAGLLPDSWRLRREQGSGRLERVVHVAVTSPARAGSVAVVGLVVVFAGLLAAGPPTQWLG